MWKLYPFSKTWEGNIAVIIHSYETVAIFILSCDHQDNESESREMEIGVDGPMFTHKNIKFSVWQWYPSYTIWVKNIVVILHICGAFDVSHNFMDTTTLNLSNG